MKYLKWLAAPAALAASLANAALAPVTEVSELPALQGQVKILDIQRKPEEFAKARIPGSVQVGYGAFRGPKSNPGALPKLAELAAALGAQGLSTEDPIIIAHAGRTSTDFGAAARVYWTLKSVGYQDLSVLNGGYEATPRPSCH